MHERRLFSCIPHNLSAPIWKYRKNSPNVAIWLCRGLELCHQRKGFQSPYNSQLFANQAMLHYTLIRNLGSKLGIGFQGFLCMRCDGNLHWKRNTTCVGKNWFPYCASGISNHSSAYNTLCSLNYAVHRSFWILDIVEMYRYIVYKDL